MYNHACAYKRMYMYSRTLALLVLLPLLYHMPGSWLCEPHWSSSICCTCGQNAVLGSLCSCFQKEDYEISKLWLSSSRPLPLLLFLSRALSRDRDLEYSALDQWSLSLLSKLRHQHTLSLHHELNPCGTRASQWAPCFNAPSCGHH